MPELVPGCVDVCLGGVDDDSCDEDGGVETDVGPLSEASSVRDTRAKGKSISIHSLEPDGPASDIRNVLGLD